MTYYEFLDNWMYFYAAKRYVFICGDDCKCPFNIGSDADCAFPEGARFTNFNQLVNFAQGLRKAGLLK